MTRRTTAKRNTDAGLPWPWEPVIVEMLRRVAAGADATTVEREELRAFVGRVLAAWYSRADTKEIGQLLGLTPRHRTRSREQALKEMKFVVRYLEDERTEGATAAMKAMLMKHPDMDRKKARRWIERWRPYVMQDKQPSGKGYEVPRT